MSSDDSRISTEELLALAEPVHVDTLTRWEGDPYAGDVGQRALQSETFGQLDVVYTYGTEVLYGQDLVEAQRHQPDDDGFVPAVDLAKAGYSRIKAEAAADAKWAIHRGSTVDSVLLAELRTRIIQEDEAIALAVGYDGDDLDALIEQIEQDQHNVGLNDEDDEHPEPIEPPTDPVTKRGDVWLLGDHRIKCGDCRDADDVAGLLDGATINLAFTSPPYADRRKYDETSGFKPIPPDEYVEWFEPVQANVREHLADDGSWFVNIKAGSYGGERDLYVLDLVLAHRRAWGWRFVDDFCWLRAGLPGHPLKMGRRFKNAHEPLYQFSVSESFKMNPDSVRSESDSVFSYAESKASGLTSKSWASHQGEGRGNTTVEASIQNKGLAFPSNVIDSEKGGAGVHGHSAAFPVGLPDFFVRAYTGEGDAVFDPFMGSGSTLLAADQNGRICYGTELSPGYVDVIAARYERATGIKPVLEASGEPVSFMDATA